MGASFYTILSRVNAPYPFLFTRKRSIITGLLVSVLIFIINWISSTDVYVSEHFAVSRFWLCAIAAFITFICILLVVYIIPSLFFSYETKENWTVKREFLITVTLLFTIALVNNMVFRFLQYHVVDFNIIQSFLNASFYVAAIGSVPVGFIIWVNYTIILKQNLRVVSQYNKELESRLANTGILKTTESNSITLKTNNQDETLRLDLNAFLFAKADGNYIDVFTRIEDKIKTETYRLTIQKLEEELEQYNYIIRSHRSFLINLRHIEQTFGNARNYRVVYAGISVEIPVSRNKFKVFKESFDSMSRN